MLAKDRGGAGAHLLGLAADPALGGDGGLEEILERTVAAQQLGGRLRADAGRARQPVGGVAAQGDEVRDERRRRRRSARAPVRARSARDGRPSASRRPIRARRRRHTGRGRPSAAGPRRRAAASARASENITSSASSVSVAATRPAEAGEQRGCALPLVGQLRRHRIAVGVVGRVELDAVVGLLGAHAGDDAPAGRGGPAPAGGSTSASSALTVPSSALTGRPSPSVIDFGSAKKERYSSQGVSAISSGPGTRPSLRRRAGRKVMPAAGRAPGPAGDGGRRALTCRRCRRSGCPPFVRRLGRTASEKCAICELSASGRVCRRCGRVTAHPLGVGTGVAGHLRARAPAGRRARCEASRCGPARCGRAPA